MSPRRGSRLACVAALGLGSLLGLAGCKKSSSDPVPAPAPTFNQFVRDLITATSDETDPIDVNDRQFEFDEDPAAFDDLFEQK